MPSLTFTEALDMAESQARRALAPALHDRLLCAVALVHDGMVVQATGHAWYVRSRSTPTTYTVNGACSCDDVQFNRPQYCKHQLAVFLARRVMQLMQSPAAPIVPDVVEPWPDNDPEGPCIVYGDELPEATGAVLGSASAAGNRGVMTVELPQRAQDAPAAPGVAPSIADTSQVPTALPEARASLNFHAQIRGFDVQITLRDFTEEHLLTRLEAILKRPDVRPVPKPAPKGNWKQRPSQGR